MNESSVHPIAEDSPGFLLWRVSTLWSKITTVVLKPLGLTHPQFIILSIVDWLTDKGSSLEEIGRQAILDPKTTSHLLRSLQVKGLIELSHMSDEKNKFPQLTIAGTEMLAKAVTIVESSDEAFFASIGQKKSGMVTNMQILARINLSKSEGKACTFREKNEES